MLCGAPNDLLAETGNKDNIIAWAEFNFGKPHPSPASSLTGASVAGGGTSSVLNGSDSNSPQVRKKV